MPNRRQLLGRLAALPLLYGASTLRALAADEDAALRAAIAGTHRSADNRARDGARHPYETLRFFGLRPDQKVVEIAPGAGWFTEILAPYLRDRGEYYAAHYAYDNPLEYRRKLRAGFDAKLAARPDLYDRVKVGLFTTADTLDGIAPADGADLVLTFRNVHNWIEAGHLDAALHAFAQVLKPGGVLGVEEHRAVPGTSLDEIKRTGYVTEAFLIERARAAGFELAARSEINANPRDSKDYPNGVWSLPPTLRGGDVDRERFMAIGESDRFTHRYVKVGQA